MKTRILNSHRLGSGSSKMRLSDWNWLQPLCCLCGVGRYNVSFPFPILFLPIIFTAISSSSATARHQSLVLPQHLCDTHWDGFPLLAERGVESVSITPGHGWGALDVNQPCQPLWRLPVSSAHPLCADMIWWEMIQNNSTLALRC